MPYSPLCVHENVPGQCSQERADHLTDSGFVLIKHIYLL